MGLGFEGKEVTVLWDLETAGSQQSESQAGGLTAWPLGALTYSLIEAVTLVYTRSCKCPSIRLSSTYFTIYHPSAHLPIRSSTVYPHTHQSTYLFMNSTCPPTRSPTIHSYTHPHTQPFTYPSKQPTYLSIHLPTYPSTFLLIRVSVHPSIYLPSTNLPIHVLYPTTHPPTFLPIPLHTQSCSHLPPLPLPSAHPSSTHLPFYLLVHKHPSFSVLPLTHLVTHFLWNPTYVTDRRKPDTLLCWYHMLLSSESPFSGPQSRHTQEHSRCLHTDFKDSKPPGAGAPDSHAYLPGPEPPSIWADLACGSRLRVTDAELLLFTRP